MSKYIFRNEKGGFESAYDKNSLMKLCYEEISDLEAKLAEKQKEIEKLNACVDFYKSYYISFKKKVIDELEKVKAELVKLKQDYSLSWCGIKIYNFIDDQIKELKGEK